MLFIAAPWYPRTVKRKSFFVLPPHTFSVIQVYEDDRINSWRIAGSIYERLSVSPQQKLFWAVRSNAKGFGAPRAAHGAILCRRGEEDASVIDYHAVFPALDIALFHGIFKDRTLNASTVIDSGTYRSAQGIRNIITAHPHSLRKGGVSLFW
jgi:hypothetical protein